MSNRTIHPGLRIRARVILQEELGPRRAEEALLALDVAWAVLGYTKEAKAPWALEEMHALASIIAGLLEAERIVAGGTPVEWKHRRGEVRLRLIKGGDSVIASTHDGEEEDDVEEDGRG